MKIEFSQEKTIVTRPAETKKTKVITIISIIDNYNAKKVIALTKEAGNILLWSGADYESAGQWTDTDVENRINEILN